MLLPQILICQGVYSMTCCSIRQHRPLNICYFPMSQDHLIRPSWQQAPNPQSSMTIRSSPSLPTPALQLLPRSINCPSPPILSILLRVSRSIIIFSHLLPSVQNIEWDARRSARRALSALLLLRSCLSPLLTTWTSIYAKASCERTRLSTMRCNEGRKTSSKIMCASCSLSASCPAEHARQRPSGIGPISIKAGSIGIPYTYLRYATWLILHLVWLFFLSSPKSTISAGFSEVNRILLHVLLWI